MDKVEFAIIVNALMSMRNALLQEEKPSAYHYRGEAQAGISYPKTQKHRPRCRCRNSYRNYRTACNRLGAYFQRNIRTNEMKRKPKL